MNDSDNTRNDNRLFARLGLAPCHANVERVARLERLEDDRRKTRTAQRRAAARRRNR